MTRDPNERAGRVFFLALRAICLRREYFCQEEGAWRY